MKCSFPVLIFFLEFQMYDLELPDPDNKPFKRAEGKYHDSRLTF